MEYPHSLPLWYVFTSMEGGGGVMHVGHHVQVGRGKHTRTFLLMTMHTFVCRILYPLWQKHQDRTKYCQWELDRAGAELKILRLFPVLLSKLLTSDMSPACQRVLYCWRLTVTTWELLAVSRHSDSPLQQKEQGSQAAIHHSSIIWIMKIVVGNNWIGIMTFHISKEDCIPLGNRKLAKVTRLFFPLSLPAPPRKKESGHETKARLPHK